MSSRVPNPTFQNPQWEKCPIHILILRLSSLRNVERSTPHLFLAIEARRGAPESYIDMAFLPDPRDRTRLLGRGLPLILGNQSRRSLREFDLVLVSNSCVPELVNLPYLFRESGIPLWAGERGEELPAVILGGSNSSAAHAVVREDGDCMADALFFGEGEGAVQRIVELWGSATGMSKRERLAALADSVPGLWPWGDLSRRTTRAVRPDSSPHRLEGYYPIMPGDEAATARLEITLGCPCLCSFCFEGHDRGPFREIPVQDLLRSARELKAASGARVLEISSFNFNTHAGITDLLLELNRVFLRVSAMSQRADILSRDAGLLEAEIAADKRSFTLGIEGISERQRRFLHKSLEAEEVDRVLSALHRPKVREVKLFFLLTGRESGEDFNEFADLLRRLKDLRGNRESNPRMVFSFGLLVRMPFTPLRYDGLLLEEKLWRPLIGKARSLCETHGFEYRLSSGWTDYLLIQLLAMGGPRLFGLLERLAAAGIVYDREFPSASGSIAAAWMAENRACMDELSREKPRDYPFAFALLETPEERAFLHAQFGKAKAFVDDGYCRRGEPNGCGNCPACTMKKNIAPPAADRSLPEPRDSGKSREISLLLQNKARLKPLYYLVQLPREAASEYREWHAAYLMREFLSRFPEHAENALSIRECLVGSWLGDGIRGGAWHGLGVAEITAWDTASVADALSKGSGGGFEAAPLSVSAAPERFASIDLSISFLDDAPSNAETVFLDALRAQHARFTVRRSGEAYWMEASDRTARRKILFGGTYGGSPQGPIFTLRAGYKLDIGALLTRLPGALLNVRGLELE